MAGMETKLHVVINEPGEYHGFSANYSGAGFSDMHFQFHGLDQKGFEAWIERVRAEGSTLSGDAYRQLEQPSQNEPVQYYADVMPGLYDRILNRCLEPGSICMKDMMDHHGGSGEDGGHHHDAMTAHD